MGRLAWRGPSASISRSAVRGLWEANHRPSKIRFHGLARSHGVCCGQRTGDLWQGRGSVRGNHKRKEWATPSEKVQTHRDTIETTPMIRRRYGLGYPSTGTAGKILAVSNFGGGGGRESRST